MRETRSAAQCKAEIIKIIRGLAHRHDLWRAFSDSMEMIAIALSNRVDPIHFEEREARYLDIAKAYTKDELTQISHILPLLMLAFDESFTDYLGQVFMELDLGNAHKGQFFTPYSISKLMALATLDSDVQKTIDAKGYLRLSEPSVGSGGMVIAICGPCATRELTTNRLATPPASMWISRLCTWPISNCRLSGCLPW